jgi:hypothetical protein
MFSFFRCVMRGKGGGSTRRHGRCAQEEAALDVSAAQDPQGWHEARGTPPHCPQHARNVSGTLSLGSRERERAQCGRGRSGKMAATVELPVGEDLNEWLAVHSEWLAFAGACSGAR